MVTVNNFESCLVFSCLLILVNHEGALFAFCFVWFCLKMHPLGALFDTKYQAFICIGSCQRQI